MRSLRQSFLALVVASLSLVWTGCIHYEMMPPTPTPKVATTAPAKGKILLKSVTDTRTTKTKHEAPGRTPVMVMGNFVFCTDEKVESVLERLLVEGFARRGYELTRSVEADGTVDATVTWFDGKNHTAMWSLSMQADLRCSITVTKGGRTQTFEVAGHGKNLCQVNRDENAQLALTRTYADFLDNLDRELEKAGL